MDVINGKQKSQIASDFFKLHLRQSSWIFASELLPPLATGMM